MKKVAEVASEDTISIASGPLNFAKKDSKISVVEQKPKQQRRSKRLMKIADKEKQKQKQVEDLVIGSQSEDQDEEV